MPGCRQRSHLEVSTHTCPLCKTCDSFPNLLKHLAIELEQIALFSLPRTLDSDDIEGSDFTSGDSDTTRPSGNGDSDFGRELALALNAPIEEGTFLSQDEESLPGGRRPILEEQPLPSTEGHPLARIRKGQLESTVQRHRPSSPSSLRPFDHVTRMPGVTTPSVQDLSKYQHERLCAEFRLNRRPALATIKRISEELTLPLQKIELR